MSEISHQETATGLRIILIRAGSTDLEDQGRITGTLDVPLSSNGEKQAAEIASAIDSIDLDAIYCSPCLSAQQTAEQLNQAEKLKIKIDDQLANLDHGLWHGMLIEDLKDNQPKIFKQWQDNPDSICPPDGETVESARARVAKSLKKIIKKHRTGTIAIVAPHPLVTILRCEIENNEVVSSWLIDRDAQSWESLLVSVA